MYELFHLTYALQQQQQQQRPNRKNLIAGGRKMWFSEIHYKKAYNLFPITNETVCYIAPRSIPFMFNLSHLIVSHRITLMWYFYVCFENLLLYRKRNKKIANCNIKIWTNPTTTTKNNNNENIVRKTTADSIHVRCHTSIHCSYKYNFVFSHSSSSSLSLIHLWFGWICKQCVLQYYRWFIV